MATITTSLQGSLQGSSEKSVKAVHDRVLGVGRRYRTVVLVLTALFFLVPVVASLRYSVVGNNNSISFSSYGAIFSDPQFFSSLFTSFKIAIGTVAITVFLVTPTVVWARLRRPDLMSALESVALLPLIVPSVVVTLGILSAFASLPNIIMGSPVILALEYVVLALPYTFRSIDAGAGAIDIRTLVEASRSLGGGWIATLTRVIIPNLKSGILSAVFLSTAFVFGEFAVASLMSFSTFPVWLVQVGQDRASESVALSVVALLLTWGGLVAVSIAGLRSTRRRSAVIEDELFAFGEQL